MAEEENLHLAMYFQGQPGPEDGVSTDVNSENKEEMEQKDSISLSTSLENAPNLPRLSSASLSPQRSIAPAAVLPQRTSFEVCVEQGLV